MLHDLKEASGLEPVSGLDIYRSHIVQGLVNTQLCLETDSILYRPPVCVFSKGPIFVF